MRGLKDLQIGHVPKGARDIEAGNGGEIFLAIVCKIWLG